MEEYGRIESCRAERFGTSFSVALVHFDRGEGGQPGELASFLKGVLPPILSVTRDCDVAGMIDEERLLMVLPHTDYFDSLNVVRKLRKAAAAAAGGLCRRIHISHATFPRDARGFGELVGAAEKRLAQRSRSLWERMGLEGKLFWEILAQLKGVTNEGLDYACFDTGEGLEFPTSLLQRLTEMVIQEVIRSPDKRGILYLGLGDTTPDQPILKLLRSVGETATRIFVVSKEEEMDWEITGAVPIHIGDLRLSDTFFTLFFSEETAYAVIASESWGGQYSCFHTSDPCLVEGLITKLQRDYNLQEQF